MLILYSIGMWDVVTLAREGWNIEVSKVVVHSHSRNRSEKLIGLRNTLRHFN